MKKYALLGAILLGSAASLQAVIVDFSGQNVTADEDIRSAISRSPKAIVSSKDGSAFSFPPCKTKKPLSECVTELQDQPEEITGIDFSSNHISDKGIQQLKEVFGDDLERLSNLQELNLSFTTITKLGELIPVIERPDFLHLNIYGSPAAGSPSNFIFLTLKEECLKKLVLFPDSWVVFDAQTAGAGGSADGDADRYVWASYFKDRVDYPEILDVIKESHIEYYNKKKL